MKGLLCARQPESGPSALVRAFLRTVDNLMAPRVILLIRIGRLVRLDVQKITAALSRFDVRAVGDGLIAREDRSCSQCRSALDCSRFAKHEHKRSCAFSCWLAEP